MAACRHPHSVGLQRLASLDSVRVKQKTTMIANKYVITTDSGDILFIAKEDSSALGLLMGGKNRPFHIDLLDTNEQTVIKLRRPYCMMTSKLEVSVCGQLASVVRQESTFFKPVLSVNDASDQPVLRVKGPSCYSGAAEFEVFNLHKQRIACITKKWGGFMREMFTSSDSFHITFPKDFNVRYKAALIGTCLLIDFLYYERRS